MKKGNKLKQRKQIGIRKNFNLFQYLKLKHYKSFTKCRHFGNQQWHMKFSAYLKFKYVYGYRHMIRSFQYFFYIWKYDCFCYPYLTSIEVAIHKMYLLHQFYISISDCFVSFLCMHNVPTHSYSKTLTRK